MTSRRTAGNGSDSPALSTHTRNELREKLAELEHIQWQAWSTTLLAEEEISADRTARWHQCFVPYDQLPEAMKEYDREWADKVLEILDDLRPDDRDAIEQLRARLQSAEERIKLLEAPKDEAALAGEPERGQRAPWWRRLFS